MKVLRQFVVIACSLLASGFVARAQTNYLAWHEADGRVDANIRNEALWPLLENIAKQTGWHIFVEPGATRIVSTRFNNVSSGDALKMLLGDLNFAFVPKIDTNSELYVFRTEMKNATREVVEKKPAKHVPNELLLKLKPGTNMEALAKLLHAKITGHLDKDGVYRLEFADASATDAALTQLQNNGDIQAVDYNYYFDPPPPTQQISSGSSTPLSLSLNPPSSNGKVVVALIDTSVNVQSLGPDAAQFVLPQINAVDASSSSDSGPTHGTAMLATLLQTIQGAQNSMGSDSTSVQVQPINVYDASGEQTTSWNVVLGLEQAVQAGDPVINMSLGSSGDSQVLDQYATELTSKGYTIFAAAGNTPTGEPYYPAADSGVYAVTALGQPGQLASYANTWPDPTMMALPGTGAFIFDGQSWVVQGTSTSTAIASALYSTYSADGRTPSQILTAMGKQFRVPAQ